MPESSIVVLWAVVNVYDLTEIQKIWALPTHLVQALVGWWSGDVLGSLGGLKSVTLCSATNNRSSCMQTQNPNNWSPRGLLKLHKKSTMWAVKKKTGAKEGCGIHLYIQSAQQQHDQRSYCSRYHQWVHAWAKDLGFGFMHAGGGSDDGCSCECCTLNLSNHSIDAALQAFQSCSFSICHGCCHLFTASRMGSIHW